MVSSGVFCLGNARVVGAHAMHLQHAKNSLSDRDHHSCCLAMLKNGMVLLNLYSGLFADGMGWVPG